VSRRVLIVAPHPDDETLGAGGTAAKCAAQGDDVHVLIVSGHLPPLYPPERFEQTVEEARQAFAILGLKNAAQLLRLPATMLGDLPISELNARLSAVVDAVRPSVLLCPFPDRHVDHRIIFESVMVAARPVGVGRDIEILAAYETLSETHWNAPHIEPNFVPNWVVDISEFAPKKFSALACYGSQIPPWPGSRSVEAVEALAKFRGSQAGFAFGEAFHLIRMKS